MINRLILSAAAALAALAGHAATFAQTSTSPGLVTRDSYLIVTHVDTRQCIVPGCGGYFVKSVNLSATRCADGAQQAECHALELNTQALGWTDQQRAAFEAQFAKGQALVRGVIEPVARGAFTADVLTITEAWQAQGQRAHIGQFYGVKSTGIVCITAPCPSLAATKLNVIAPVINPALDLSLTGASAKQIQAGYEALNTTGILTAGVVVPVTYPPLEGQITRVGKKLLASEFYLPAQP